MRGEIGAREVEQPAAEQFDLEVVQLGDFVLFVRRDAAAAVDRAAALGHLHVHRIPRVLVAVRVVIVETTCWSNRAGSDGRWAYRSAPQVSASAGVVAQRIDGLHQALAERGLAQNPARDRDPAARR